MPAEKYSIFDQMIEGIQILNGEMEYIYVNNAVTIHAKTSKEKLLGNSMKSVYPGIENTEMYKSILQCMKDKIPSEMINEFDYINGTKGYFELRMQRVEEGVLIMSFDVTKQRHAEQLLLNSNALLEEMVKKRTSELTSKNQELEQFNYIASHDLQEPLRTVANYIQILKEDFGHTLNETINTYLNTISRANARMKILTDALLDYSRFGHNSKLCPVDLNILVKEVLDDIKNLIDTTGARIEVVNLPVLNLYETEIRQVFLNLMVNAIKFRKPGIEPVIKINAEAAGGLWKFSISDNGIGINAEHQERIFLIFQRLHAQSAYEGSGIGLAHCKKIVELHGGTISVESHPGKGSTFNFTIPTYQ